ncbi:MAG: trigger factor [Leptospirillia bacterium]
MDSLQVEVTEKEGLNREISFQIPEDVVRTALDATYENLSVNAKVPGFRKGKIPQQVVRARYGEQAKGEVIQRLVPDYYKQALQAASIEPASSPEFGPIEIKDGEPLSVTATVEIQPTVNVADYDGIELQMVDIEVQEKDIEVAYHSLRDSMATLEEAPKKHKAENGDVAVIDFEGRIGGEPFEGGKSEGYALPLGEGRFIEGFEEQIVGHAVGDSFDITVTFPEAYHNPEFSGKEAVFAVTLQDLKCKVLPEVDDAFAQQVGDFADLAALNETLKNEIRAKREADQGKLLRRQAFARLVDDNPFEPPESMVQEELADLIETRKAMLQMQGKSLEEAGFDEAKERENLLNDARNKARGQLVVKQIAKNEGVSVSEEDFQAEVARLAGEYQRPVDEVDRLIRSNQAEVARLNGVLLQDKVLNLVVERAKVTVLERPAEEAEKPKKKAAAKKPAAKKPAAKKPAAKKPAAKKPAAKKPAAKKPAAKKPAAKKKSDG